MTEYTLPITAEFLESLGDGGGKRGRVLAQRPCAGTNTNRKELRRAAGVAMTELPASVRMENMKRVAVAAVVMCLAMPAFAEEVGVHVGPVGAGVTVGSGHDRVREKEVIREREPRDKVIVKERHEPTVVEKKKTIIKDRD